MRQVLVSAQDVAAERPFLIDVTVRLAKPEFDGDYRAESGAVTWRAGHIPGSIHVDLLTELAGPPQPYHFPHPDPETVRRELTRIGATPTDRIVFTDDGSMQWSARAWWTLRDAGMDAHILDGGLRTWTDEGLPLAYGDPKPLPATSRRLPSGEGGLPEPGGTEPFPPAESRGLWADKQDVLDISQGRRPGTLVCALSAGHFNATVPTRYSRRGHIPGSVNLPAGDIEDLTTPAVLTEPVVVYCGGGVSACVVAIALVRAGHRDVRVYDGSLEEWTADPTLPLNV
ncbi:sulfurtransferase [Herbidospora mongoliensis]|uniref:sulfurtransferase n=1 Tax=Herbidospora mongoliensis TaxID=688067 RepID=UPI00082C3FAD|nr:rhodanese-like domain-containing protein [Herbidospora mongoliensis]